jgi:hypothetical protein
MGFFDAFTDENEKAAAEMQKAGLRAGDARGQPLLDTGLAKAEGSYAAGIAPFTDILRSSGAGATAYGNATGANGATGYADAVNNFHTNPGYQFTVDQALDNVARRASSTGQLASGGTNVDMANQVGALADKQWQSYVANLQPYLGQQTQAAGGNAQVNVAQAGTQNANRTNAANMAYGTEVGVGNANAAAELAKNNSSANIINGSINAAKAVAGFI